MMKSFILLSAFTTVVVAQSTISSTCSTFLTALNSDSSLTACIQPIIAAASQFGPGSTTTPTTSSVTSALNSLCSSSVTNGCPDSLIRGKLADFYTACTPELTGDSPNADVLLSYDVLYVMTPLQQAVCSKNDNGAYCVTQIPSDIVPASSKEASSPNQLPLDVIDSNLYTTSSSAPKVKRANTTTTVSPALVPNSTTFRTSNLIYLFSTPSESSTDLCVSCTRASLTPYINFQEAVPYAPGITNSPLMGGQSALYSAITQKCGANFMSGAVQAAGGLGAGVLGGGKSGAMAVKVGSVGQVGAVLAAVAVGFAGLL
ncbi:hypothetical protein BD410DRAFT_809544 [Rickenella mellea]|uniref:Uncharacterized protein n=1 Tax=Rickenella mellea TaxID=50990 RepID=A0A4Y7PHD4_9AGAM|nr:hypothetical protein BD410DRAFT_809544 [Rickenella mellea]